jgi:hypothetical protein
LYIIANGLKQKNYSIQIINKKQNAGQFFRKKYDAIDKYLYKVSSQSIMPVQLDANIAFNGNQLPWLP